MNKTIYLLFYFCFFTFALYSQQPTEEWVRRYSGLQSNYGSSGYSVKLDSIGNVYVLVGVATDSTLGDYGVLKYNLSGGLIWSAIYNSPSNLDDHSIAFAVTPAGDTYITGTSGMNFIKPISTVKFNASGILQWARVYDGGGPGDGPNDLTLDKQGNIIVTGGSATISGSTSYSLTIKYNPSGDTLWTRKFTQLGIYSVNDKVIADDSGCVYTTGYYRPDSQRSHFLTLKYSSNGNLLWYSTYFHDPVIQVDLANCIALDSNRNIYVAGISNPALPGKNRNSLLKINQNGVKLWASVYKGIGGNNTCGFPAGIASTPDGSVIYYATGSESAGNSEFVTLAYDFNGDSIWTRRFPTGYTSIVQYNPASLILDKNYNIYVTGSINSPGSSDDINTIKYLPDGTQQWMITYNGPLINSNDHAHSMIIDQNFNVFVTGISSRYNGPPYILWDAVTIKYSQIIGINSNNNQLPKEFFLAQNYPNPFNSTTIISYTLPEKSSIKLLIYDITGQLVKVLVNTEQNSGYYSIAYNAGDLSSGVYFYSLSVNNSQVDSKKFILLK